MKPTNDADKLNLHSIFILNDVVSNANNNIFRFPIDTRIEEIFLGEKEIHMSKEKFFLKR